MGEEVEVGLGQRIEEVMGLDDHDGPEPDGMVGKRVEVEANGARLRDLGGEVA